MLRVSGLRRTYGDLVAVSGLDLVVEPGQIFALLGPNGAGKSTTVQCIVGLLTPTAGKIEIDGIDVTVDPVGARRRVSYVPEVAALYDELTPVEYLQLRGRLFDLDEPTIEARSNRLLVGFGLGDRRNAPIGEFSKGMTQKVSLAAALLTQPRLLVLDEPLSGLDVETTLVFKELLRTFAGRGGTVLYCSHMLDVVETIADRIAIIDHGELAASGSLADLERRAGTEGARLEQLFQSLTKASDPHERALEILGD
ncbi:MAG: ABC transporter ATP-binding protein [Planctomycetes bacterium]|nr:ABC transporter ATP-binding protein [Planctomycetota bacterium]